MLLIKQLTGININQKNNTEKNPYLYFLIDPSFQGVHKHLGRTRYFLLTVGTKDYNVMLDGKNF